MVDTQILKEVTGKVKVLYVEDDEGLRQNTTELLSNFFPVVATAADGEEGLEKYRVGCYDLVITDIRMPKLSGTAMAAEIKKINPECPIIITSAHDEAEYLIQLINDGIEHFLLKPLDLSRLLKVLYDVCRLIMEGQIMEAYRQKLEKANLDLGKKNEELEKKIRQLTGQENKTIALVHAAAHERSISNQELGLIAKVFHAISAKDFIEQYPTDLMHQNDKLEGIEERMDICINRLGADCELADVHDLGRMFCDQGYIVDSIPEFSNLAFAMDSIGKVILKLDVMDIERFVGLKDLLYTIADSIFRWRETIFVKRETENIHYLDNALISDCIQVEALLKNQTIEGSDLELF